MAAATPQTMRAFIAPVYGPPSIFELADIPTPKITKPNQVLIKVHAASINPSDMHAASGAFKLALPSTYVPVPRKEWLGRCLDE